VDLCRSSSSTRFNRTNIKFEKNGNWKMKKLLLMAPSSILLFASYGSFAATTQQAAQLNTILTPMGAERAGSADGLIPAWTGGVTTVPSGWTPGQEMPDIYADEKPYLIINSSNMAECKDRLTDGEMAMMQKYGFSIQVYPTHRTAAYPKWVQDFTYQNALNAKPSPRGARWGFSDAFGGPPFPIPDDDNNAGAEIIWNHLTSWYGPAYDSKVSSFTVSGGIPALAATTTLLNNYPYYDPHGSTAAFNNTFGEFKVTFDGPPVLQGQELIAIVSTDPAQQPEEVWQLLQGQGRVRKAPELTFDTPDSLLGGIANFDEDLGFFGSPEEYNWKLIGKKEIYIPYNDNRLSFGTPEQELLPHFVNPSYTRFELHRVWVVDGTLAPGERNVMVHRRVYIDEDTWAISMADEWDAQGNLYHVIMVPNQLVPQFPGVIHSREMIYNVQSDQYVVSPGAYSDPSLASAPTSTLNPGQTYNPSLLAAQAQY
jgi:hypothetical protein